MNELESEGSKQAGEIEIARMLQHYIERYRLNAGLSTDERDTGLALAKKRLVARNKNFERAGQRQYELEEIRSMVWMLQNHHQEGHAGFLAMLDSIESSIERDFDSMKKGDLLR